MYIECKTDAEWIVISLTGIRCVRMMDSPRSSSVIYEDGTVIDVSKRNAEKIAAALVKSE